MSRVSMFDAVPNELFHEVFQYLTADEMLYAFKGLHKRMDTLLDKYNKYDLDFRSYSKFKFDSFCQSISPDQVRSLSLLDISEKDWQKLSSSTIRLAQGLIPKIVGLSLKHLSIGVCTMNMSQEIITCMPSLITLTVQLIAGTMPVDHSILLTTEIRRIKIELPENLNTSWSNITMGAKTRRIRISRQERL